jgi:hypothetical protein
MFAVAFVEMRLLGWEGRSEQVADLADAFHEMPREIYDPRNFNWDNFRQRLQSYSEKWKGTTWTRDYPSQLEEIRFS